MVTGLNYGMVSYYYNRGMWPIRAVRDAVIKGVITEDEYYAITGFVYPATSDGTGADA